MNSGLEAGRRTQPREMSEWKTKYPDKICVWLANEVDSAVLFLWFENSGGCSTTPG